MNQVERVDHVDGADADGADDVDEVDGVDRDGVDEVDALVVGGGPAGLAAAGWLARYRRRVLVVDSGRHRADPVESSHGYLGRDPQCPRDLLAAGRAEVLAYPTARIVAGRVADVARRDGPGPARFAATVAPVAAGTGAGIGPGVGSGVGPRGGGLRVLAHRVVLACGVRDALPPVAGIGEHYGASVFHCPACDGYEARGADVVVLGWDGHLTGFAAQLLGWAASVTVVTAGRRFVPGSDNGAGGGADAERDRARTVLDDLGVDVVEDAVEELVGERGDLRGVRLATGRVLPCSLAFFSVAHEPRTALAASLGCRIDDDGYVEVNSCNETSVEGVYAAGDLTPGLQLTSVAAAKGVVAGVACAQSFFGQPSAAGAPEPAPAAAGD